MSANTLFIIQIFLGLLMIWHHGLVQFNQPLKIDLDNKYKILSDLEISSLSSEREWNFGRFLYLSFYSFVYGFCIILWNTGDEPSADEIKGVSGPSGVPFFFEQRSSGTDLSYSFGDLQWQPLAVAAVLMSLLSVGGQLSPYEERIRRFAHRRAGIPRSIYRIAHLLKIMSTREIVKGVSTPIKKRFDNKSEEILINCDGVDKELMENISERLERIEILTPAVIGDQLEYSFGFAKQDKLSERINNLKGEVDSFVQNISELNVETVTLSGLQGLSKEIMRIENSLIAMFSVLYINTRSFDVRSIPEPTRDVVSYIKKNRVSYEFAALAWTFVISVICSVFLYLVSNYIAEIVRIVEESGKNFSLKDNFNIDTVQRVSGWAFESLFEHFVFIFTVLLFSLAIRRDRIEEDKWDSYFMNNQPPIGQYIMASFVPAVMGCVSLIVVLIAENLRYFLLNDAIVSINDVLNYSIVSDNFYYISGIFSVSIVISVGYFFISDFHSRLSVGRTLLIGCVCSLVFCLLSLLVFFFHYEYSGGAGDFNFRLWITDSVKLSFFGTISFIVYSLVIELYEDRSEAGASKE